MEIEVTTKEYIVRVFSWDLVPFPKIAEKIGQKTGWIPEQYPHVGVAVYNKLYHYGQDGLKANFEMPVGYKPKGDFFITTRKRPEEFEDWFRNQRNNFRSDTYSLSKHNCICFCRDACQFLEVDFDEELLQLLEWLSDNEKIVEKLHNKLRKSPIIMALASSSSLSASSTSGVKKSVDVLDTVVAMFNVDSELERQFRISNSGGKYLKAEAAIVDEVKSEKDTNFPENLLILSPEEFDLKCRDIGRGCFGKVYQGTFRSIEVAVKKFNGKSTQKTKNESYKELTIMAGFRHMNILHIWGLVTQDDSPPWIILEFMYRGTLDSYFHKNKLDKSLMDRMASDVCNGMVYLHEQNCIHRDLSTRNVLLDKFLNVKVADFGLSRFFGDGDEPYYSMIEGKNYSLYYTANEALPPNGKFVFASDVWSFGVLLHQIWTNASEYPYGDTSTVEEVKQKIQNGGNPAVSCPISIEYADEAKLLNHIFRPEPKARPDFRKVKSVLDEIADAPILPGYTSVDSDAEKYAAKKRAFSQMKKKFEESKLEKVVNSAGVNDGNTPSSSGVSFGIPDLEYVDNNDEVYRKRMIGSLKAAALEYRRLKEKGKGKEFHHSPTANN